MPKNRFKYTVVYDHLKQHFYKHVKLGRTSEELQIEEDKLVEIIEGLSSKIIIPPSSLDDSIRETIQRNFGVLPVETANGLSISTADLEHVNDEIYDLTVLGQIEVILRDYIIDTLRSFLTGNSNAIDVVDKQEAEYYKMVEDAWDQYREELNDFENGDYEYDYEGPVCPQEPQFESFDHEAAIAQLKQEILELDLEDPAVVLKKVSVEKGLMGDMLHECFENYELIDDIIQRLDFSGFNQLHIAHILRTKDFYFPDCDILKRGFLLEILVDNIRYDFESDRTELDVNKHVSTLLKAMSAHRQCEKLLEEYNNAVEINDTLELQRLWYYLSAFCILVEKALQKSPVNIVKLAVQLEKKFEELKFNHGNELNALIKVFPADTTDRLFFSGISGQEKGYYPSCDATFLLKPYFHTLEMIARSTHMALTKAVGSQNNAEKTNVVSAMLCFVISVESDEHLASKRYLHEPFGLERPSSKQIFINVPVNFDYTSIVLSLDEVFNDENDMEKSIGTDLEKGKRVAQRDITLPIDKTMRAKKMIMRLLGTLALTEEDKSRTLSEIETAEIGSPVMLDYLTSSDIVKSTKHRHSERVLNRTLKEPRNVAKIVCGIKESMLEQGITRSGTYAIHSVALLVYSYPNSICDECGVSFLALQNSYDRGFIAEFVRAANTDDPGSSIRLRTRGFNPLTGEQDSDEFGITVIAASSKVFARDPYAKLMVNRPEAKYSCHVTPSSSEEGINLRYKKPATGHNRFYEYTAGSELNKDDNVTVPYAGTLFMSGSKESKLSSRKRKRVDAEVEKIVRGCDEEAATARSSMA